MGVAKTANSRGQRKSELRKKTSYKTKKPDIGSKRKLAKFGKRQRTGHSGTAIQYVSRTRALKLLQISLKDFRRLCILKGIYPRDPTKKPIGKRATAYYHAKDIAFLQHEPILEKFREMKAVTKKIVRRLGRNEKSEAVRAFENRPKYTLDHVVRERYPTFLSALSDLDDGLTLIHLFANLPISLATADHGPRCARLSKEWQFFVAKSKTLRKAFVSIKGVYYQAEVRGVPLTWLVPHKFVQDAKRLEENKQIDFRVMRTFLEFYETLLEFVMYKLYAEELKCKYPPSVLAGVEEAGGFLKALRADTLATTSLSTMEVDDSKASSVTMNKKEKKKTGASALEKKLAKVVGGLVKIPLTSDNDIEYEQNAHENEDERGDEENTIIDESHNFADDENVRAVLKHQQESDHAVNLFRGMRVFLSREVPLEPVEFCIECFGGFVLRSDLGDLETDPTISHVVTDRPMDPMGERQIETIPGREYVQPQWIFDCINAKMILPVGDYHPSIKLLPPHLSPFVDDQSEGYIPVRAAEIEDLRRARASNGGTESLLRATGVLVEQNEDAMNRNDLVASDDENDAELEDSDESEEEKSDSSADNDKTRTTAKSVQSQNRQQVIFEQPDSDDEGDNVVPEDNVMQPPKARSQELFIPSSSFAGARAGFYFRRGVLGVGYYCDSGGAIRASSTKSVATLEERRKFNVEKETREGDRQTRLAESTEANEMRTIIMSKKARHLYDRMQHGIAKKKTAVQMLEKKRRTLDERKSR